MGRQSVMLYAAGDRRHDDCGTMAITCVVLNNQHRSDASFANYRTVRKIVQGMMDNLDVTMVSNKTITKSVEVQHLQTPDYWLTCVLISIMAWKNNDRELSDRALARAVRLDKKDSAIFYMLFNLRMGRDEAALKWFYTYQECDLKGSDQRTFLMLFSLVSKTLADNVDDSTKNEIFSCATYHRPMQTATGWRDRPPPTHRASPKSASHP